jgi:hypothetical protein
MSSVRRQYSPQTLKVLFALSGNQCAHPECNNPVIAPGNEISDPLVVAQICHIFAASNDGPRSHPDLSEDQRNSADNLILLCPTHHRIVDGQFEKYPVETLKLWKRQHEGKFQSGLEDGASTHRYRHPQLGIALSLRGRTAAYLDEYLSSETRTVPFGGRDAELARLDSWLKDASAPSRMLLTAPAGRGKSALVVQWIKSLYDAGIVRADQWHLAFMPISIRSSTNRPEIYYEGIARRLAEITAETLPREISRDAEVSKYWVRDQLEKLAAAGTPVLVVIDGLDEALQRTFDPTILPTNLSPNLRILVSARWQVGDFDSSGWLRRLGWDRVIRAEVLELDKLSMEGVGDVLTKTGVNLDVQGRDHPIVAQLAALTEREPLLVRFYAEDLWEIRERGARITKDDLVRLKPGFQSYFEQWMGHQEELWAKEGLHVDHSDIEKVLSILAFAIGPLTSEELLELIRTVYHNKTFFVEHRLLQSLRRFVIGGGQADHGYVLSHPKIGEYFRQERFRIHSKDISSGYAAWAQEHLRSINSGRTHSNQASSYALQFLRKHFEDASLPPAAWMELVENGWQQAWESYEAGPRGFYDDVHAAWMVVRRDAPASVDWQWRCVLVLCSIRTLGRNMPGELLIQAVKHGLIPGRQAALFLEMNEDKHECAKFLVHLALLPLSNALLTAELLTASLQQVIYLTDGTTRTELLRLLAARLAPDEIDAAFVTCESIIEEQRRAAALTSLVPHLSERLRSVALSKIVKLVATIHSEKVRAELLSSLGRYLSKSNSHQIIQEFVAASQRMDDKAGRVRVLASISGLLSPVELTEALILLSQVGEEYDLPLIEGLAPHLLPEHFSHVQAIIKLIGDKHRRSRVLYAVAPYLAAQFLAGLTTSTDEEYRARLLEWIAPHLSTPQLAEAMGLSRAIANERLRANALGALAPHLSPEERDIVVSEAFAAMKQAPEEWERMFILMDLAPVLSPPHLIESLTIIKAAKSEGHPMLALMELAKYISGEQLAEVIDTTNAVGMDRATMVRGMGPRLSAEQLAAELGEVRSIEGDEDRAKFLIALAPYLPSDQFGEALGAAGDIAEIKHRAEVLVSFAPRLSSEQLSTVLLMAKSIKDVSERKTVLGAFAPFLSREQLIEALAIARVIGDRGELTEALASLARFLPQDKQDATIAAAFEGWKSVKDKELRSRILALLTPQLSPELLAEALACAQRTDDDAERTEVLALLAPKLSWEQRTEALRVEFSRGTDKDRGTPGIAIALLAPHLPDDLAAKVISNIGKIEDATERTIGFASLALYLSGPRRDDVVAAAIAASKSIEITDGINQARASAALAKYLSNGAMTEMVARALTAARTSNIWIRSLALMFLAPHLSEDQWLEILAVLDELDDKLSLLMLQKCTGSAGHLQRRNLLDRLLTIVVKFPRDEAFRALAASSIIVNGIGGKDAILNVRRALDDVVLWYP